MTVLEWLKNRTRFSLDEGTLIEIALDRECAPGDDVYCGMVTKRQRDLMTADIIYNALILSPSSTASLSLSHNGFQKTVGSEQNTYIKDKLENALFIYRKYGDDKAEQIDAAKPKIRFIPIVDVDRL